MKILFMIVNFLFLDNGYCFGKWKTKGYEKLHCARDGVRLGVRFWGLGLTWVKFLRMAEETVVSWIVILLKEYHVLLL